jgi:hypothetical protein
MKILNYELKNQETHITECCFTAGNTYAAVQEYCQQTKKGRLFANAH